MVRATIIVSALVAMVATVSAGSLVDVRAKKHIGTGDINAQGLGNHAVNANNLRVQGTSTQFNFGFMIHILISQFFRCCSKR